MDLEPIRSSSSSSGSSSSSSSSASGSVSDDAHACVLSIANPSISSSGHCSKRKLSDVACADVAQLPQTPVVLRGDLSGRSLESSDVDSTASSQTTDLRADADHGCGSANEEKSGGEVENGSVVDSRDSSPSSGNSKKKSKRQKRKAKLQSAEKKAVIAEARGAWYQMKKQHKLCMEAADELEQFDMMEDLKRKGAPVKGFEKEFMATQRHFDVLHEGLVECWRRLNQFVSGHPSILRAKGGFEGNPLDLGTFEEHFDIL